MQDRCVEGAVGVRSVIAEKIDQRKLQAAFTRHSPCSHQPERLVNLGLRRAGIKNNLGYINNVRGELAVANRILGDELKQRGVMKIVPTFECDMLMYQLRMLLQITTQSCRVPCVNKIDGTAKNRVFDSFMVGEIQIGRFFDMLFQPRPALETRLTSDGELRIAEL